MSNNELPATKLSMVEEELGRAMVLIQRVLARLDDPKRAAAVQADLRGAGACLESARSAWETNKQFPVSAETAAVIAAAIAALLDGPYRLVSVKPAAASAPNLNVWALEGRTQIFQSHKIR
jgi:hypothetical protein